MPGGGVCGAIHAKAGPRLYDACKPLAPCPTGDARITPGFDLPARYVIHTVGPVWRGGDQNEDALLARCYRKSLLLGIDHDLKSIAFPAISTGIFGFPEDRAAAIAISTICDVTGETGKLPQIYLCSFTQSSRRHLEDAIATLLKV